MSRTDAGALDLDPRIVERLAAHLDLLRKWQPRINLVGPSTLEDAWNRHILDSAQLARLIPEGAGCVADLGSGAGFPGLVIAVVTGRVVELVESDARKAAFLREAARASGAAVKIHNSRIESLPPLGADVLTARALAPLERLLGFAERHLAPGGCCLFMKGRDWDQELTASTKEWMISHETIPSLSDPSGVILKIGGVTRRHGRADSRRR